MKRIILLTALAGLLLTACGPQTYTKYMHVRQPSRSGMDLSKRTMSVVYLSDKDSLTEIASAKQANFLAANLEKDYFGGEEKVALYRLEKDPKGDYSQRDTLIRMVVGTGDDVVFLVDTPEQGHQAAYNVYVLDSMSGSDEVKKFAGENRIGDEFSPEWVLVNFDVLYFEAASRWDKATDYVEMDQWEDAMKVWMEIASDSRNNLRRAAACYNTAIASWLLGEKELAIKWLDRADASYKLDSAITLRRLFKTLK
ncbi:MAG: DUF6340 family protein [Bacteroidota bacterium]|nr:DUF6340 family protein [Bacteroidota bacterium]